MDELELRRGQGDFDGSRAVTAEGRGSNEPFIGRPVWYSHPSDPKLMIIARLRNPWQVIAYGKGEVQKEPCRSERIRPPSRAREPGRFGADRARARRRGRFACEQLRPGVAGAIFMDLGGDVRRARDRARGGRKAQVGARDRDGFFFPGGDAFHAGRGTTEFAAQIDLVRRARGLLACHSRARQHHAREDRGCERDRDPANPYPHRWLPSSPPARAGLLQVIDAGPTMPSSAREEAAFGARIQWSAWRARWPRPAPAAGCAATAAGRGTSRCRSTTRGSTRSTPTPASAPKSWTSCRRRWCSAWSACTTSPTSASTTAAWSRSKTAGNG